MISARGEVRVKKTLSDSGEWLLLNVYFVDGVEVSKKEFDRVFPDAKPEVGTGIVRKTCNAWPMKSDGVAVHPKDRAAAIADAKRLGVPTYFDRQGRAVFESLGHQRRYLKLKGFFNKDDNSSGQSRTYRKEVNPKDYDVRDPGE